MVIHITWEGGCVLSGASSAFESDSARQSVRAKAYNCAEHSKQMPRMCEAQVDGTYRGVVLNHAVDIPMLFSANAESEDTGAMGS
jgi:hypothetical protein